MSLPSATVLKNNILNLKPTDNQLLGITSFVGVIADYMNLVQAGSTGSIGIFTFGNAAMIAGLQAMMPVSDNSWIVPFVQAFEDGCDSASITPGTVINPIWIGSGGLDVATLPTGAATITTIPKAGTILTSALMSAKPDSSAPTALANGIRDATLAFIFTCIGLGSPPIFAPIPIPIPAQ